MKTKKRTHYYSVECSYNDKYCDSVLEDAVGKMSDGSGSGFGGRDLSWYFDHLQQALKAFKALSKYKYLDTLLISFVKDN